MKIITHPNDLEFHGRIKSETRRMLLRWAANVLQPSGKSDPGESVPCAGALYRSHSPMESTCVDPAGQNAAVIASTCFSSFGTAGSANSSNKT
jgi:hypothetical protein